MTATPRHVDSYDLYGGKITPVTIDDLLSLLESYVDCGQQCIVASQNMHGLRVRLQDAAMRRLHELPQTYVHIDGMPLVLLSRLRGIQASRRHRVTLVDFIWPLLALAERRAWRVYFLGGSDAVVQAASGRIGARFPRLDFRARQGYFEESSSSAVASQIASFAPHVVLVGMGMGRQESWILDHYEALAPASIVTVGACMEYIAGTVGTPPRWMGRTGLEWLYRFAENPSRFWRRYLIEPWIVLAYVLWYTVSR
jgi:N-acetylglucosaminyldiphosphoundecaprenol N-acetyl-beta-D-mannosaminyltransferase